MHPLPSLALASFLLAQVPAEPPPMPPGVEKLERRAMENLYRVTPRLYSGGQPEGEAAFRRLRELGVATIVSVDGIEPQVELARKFGLRYVHVPIGYDGVPRTAAVQIAAAVQQSKGPVYIHCHHGKHRGPAAVAVACLAWEGWTKEQARGWLARAGTSPAYRGLFADVQEFQPLAGDELTAAKLVDRVPPPPLVEAMLAVADHYEPLEAAGRANFRGLKPDELARRVRSATLLVEAYRELGRLPAVKTFPEDFEKFRAEGERRAAALAEALHKLALAPEEEAARTAATAALAAARNNCQACHEVFRDVRPAR